jgi:hypothetical protein
MSNEDHMIIGLVGVAGSGKTTAANFLVRERRFTRIPFADPLKKMIEALGFHRSLLDGPAKTKEQPLAAFNGRTLREAMQTLGTEWGRKEFGDDFWVRMWEGAIGNAQKIVVDDVRFPNEAAKIKELGGLLVRMHRNDAGASVGTAHASEQVGLINPDVHILNNSDDFRILYAQIDRVLTQEQARRVGN